MIVIEALPSEDHGVGDVGALEFVETKHRALLGEVGGHGGQGVEVEAMGHLLPVHAPMHVLHEMVKMYAGLGDDVGWECIEEHVHQHRLAAAHVAVQIEAGWRTIWYWARSVPTPGPKPGLPEGRWRRPSRV